MKLAVIAALVLSTSALATEGQHGHENHGRRPENKGKATTQQVGVNVSQSALAEARAQSSASARSSSSATGGNATGGVGGSAAGGAGGNATATGGQVVVSNGGNGSGLTGRIVPDVSASSPITSTSCRNGITAGGSGNGWGGLLGLFSEDEICELRLLWEQFRTAGMHDKADKLLEGMMAIRCEKMAPDQRKFLGDLCPKPPVQESQNAAFASAG